MCNEPWISTYSGKRFYPTNLEKSDIDINDIAHSLSNMCRFGGHSTRFYSVAEHSVLVSRSLPEKYALWGLLHDATEAYLVDIPSPVKQLFPEYKGLENELMKHIAKQFIGRRVAIPRIVKNVDVSILANEAAQAMKDKGEPWNLPKKTLDVRLNFWSPKRAKTEFLTEFHELSKDLPKVAA